MTYITNLLIAYQECNKAWGMTTTAQWVGLVPVVESIMEKTELEWSQAFQIVRVYRQLLILEFSPDSFNT